MEKLICFDLEGPLSPQDNAFEVMGMVENGHKLFEAISLYDDLLTLDNKPGYEPGDTLALIVPFLLYHGLKEQSVEAVSKRAMLLDGAVDLVKGLQDDGWGVYIISTSYEQHAHNIGSQLGVLKANIHCTSFPLSQFQSELTGSDMELISEVEQKLLGMYPLDGKDAELKEVLDDFYWSRLNGTPLGNIIKNLNVVGGQRKIDAALKIAEANGTTTGEIAVVGDSITDFKMLKEVNKAGGLAVAFNANSYAVPYGTISLASESLNDLRPVLDAWQKGDRKGALDSLNELMARPDREEKYFFHDLAGREKFDDIIEIHKRFRSAVRGRAAKLG